MQGAGDADEAAKTAELARMFKKESRTRAGHRAHATKIANQSKIWLANKNVNTEEEKEKMATELVTNTQILQDKIRDLKYMDEKIAELIEDDQEYTDEIVANGDYNKELLKAVVESNRWLDSYEKKKEGAAVMSPKPQKTKRSKSKLPKFQLIKFDGNPLKYQSFWDCFESAVHKDGDEDDISKFILLKGTLEGEAVTAIEGLSLTSENYAKALELLKERFGDEQRLIEAYMEELLSITPVKSYKPATLRKLCDTIEIHTRNLESCKVEMESYGPILNSLTMSKLPTKVQLSIRQQMPIGTWDNKELMTILKKDISARERCGTDHDYEDDDFDGRDNENDAMGSGRRSTFKGNIRRKVRIRISSRKICARFVTNHTSRNYAEPCLLSTKEER